MNKILVYCSSTSPRLKYITDLILGDLLGLEVTITNDQEEFINSQEAKICYNNRHLSPDNECMIVPYGLLNERGLNNHLVNVIDFADTKGLFPVYSSGSSLTFDIFSAAFYMVSRYEEYLPFIRDQHGRFPASSTLASQKGFLQKPVVNIWAKELGKILQELFPSLEVKSHTYKFVPTIDIDAAWAFRHKGFYRTIGGFLKDLQSLDMESFTRRYKSLFNLEADPFDSYEVMHKLHRKYAVRPLFFVLFSDYDEFDKNTPINNMAFHKLIKSMADEGEVGIHPSYASNRNENRLQQEIAALSDVVHAEIYSSRQHFIKLSFPDTYRNLIANDIVHDYTMGFASDTGFRAGICTSFNWYDIEMERITNLEVHPFAVMDGTLRDYLMIEAEGAMTRVSPLIKSVKEVGGTFISLFHNESLSEWRRWKGWVEVYEEILKEGSEF